MWQEALQLSSGGGGGNSSTVFEALIPPLSSNTSSSIVTLSSSSYYPGCEAFKAFDGVFYSGNNEWASEANKQNNAYIDITFANPTQVDMIMINHYRGRMKNFKFLGSPSGAWSGEEQELIVGLQENYTSNPYIHISNYMTINPKEYKYYRFLVIDSYEIYAGICEMQLFKAKN